MKHLMEGRRLSNCEGTLFVCICSAGSLGVDLEKMIQHFSLGKTYQSEKLQTEVSKIRLNLGMVCYQLV